jgi:hypothetical protein
MRLLAVAERGRGSTGGGWSIRAETLRLAKNRNNSKNDPCCEKLTYINKTWLMWLWVRKKRPPPVPREMPASGHWRFHSMMASSRSEPSRSLTLVIA